ncbi:MAG: hypothetical protein EXR72_11785 [Myxococcales bacterium]|nr:hypothetical protein [Myxococcales bacterium]
MTEPVPTAGGLIGERKAIALLCLGFYASYFLLMALILGSQAPEWVPLFGGWAACYTIAFFAVAAGWFWGRWFALGLGLWGVLMGGMILLVDPLPQAIAFAVMHALIVLCMAGTGMAAAFESRPGWREQSKLDDRAVGRLRTAVILAAVGLPWLILRGLAPSGGSLGLVVLGSAGLFGLLRGRTWGVLALGGAGLVALGGGLLGTPHATASGVLSPLPFGLPAGLLLTAAATPFARPIARYLTR